MEARLSFQLLHTGDGEAVEVEVCSVMPADMMERGLAGVPALVGWHDTLLPLSLVRLKRRSRHATRINARRPLMLSPRGQGTPDRCDPVALLRDRRQELPA